METRIWYLREGQSLSSSTTGMVRDAPSTIARLLPDGTTQITQFAYTASGNVNQTIDPLNRQVQASYDSTGTDITAAQRKTAAGADTLAQYTYGAVPHRPVTYTDAAGQVWHMSYNPQGQLLTAT
ncbi:MAG: hypothetical protein LBU72_09625, partial [Burkholderiaceae bacterium]|nr:hypothetical protein [Burkholderiaceae bacterium]